ncbi:MAG: carbamate kinase, partial [Gemmatimonadales bacterium]
GVIVIAAGGGGPPVYRHPALGLEGLDGVVDKDRAAAILAREMEAEVFLILTDVNAVYRDFGTAEAAPLRRLSLEEADALIASGALDEGGMRPKVEAAAAFVRSGKGRAIIAHLTDGSAALRGETGTTITRTT